MGFRAGSCNRGFGSGDELELEKPGTPEKTENNMARKLKTVKCWRFYLNYGQGWEHEITEFTREAMKENRKAYRENCPQYGLRIVCGRERVTMSHVRDLNLNPDLYDIAPEEQTT